MARLKINILGISELKWTGIGEHNSDDHYVYYCGQESLRRNGVALIVNKRVWNVVLGCNLKNDRMICLLPRQTIQHQSNSSLRPNLWCQRIWSWLVIWRPTRPSRTNSKKTKIKNKQKKHFHQRGLECKRRNSRYICNNRQVCPWNTKWSRAKANSFVKRTCWS